MSTFNLSNKIKIVNPVANIDNDYGVYNSILEAETAIPAIVRKGGKTVGILEGGNVVEYWWESDSSTNLVKKISVLQKVITFPTDFTGINYTLTNEDSNFEVIINNGTNNVTITVPTGLLSKIGIGFTQKGSGEVLFIPSGTTINNPIGLKIKGQFYQTYLSQELKTNIFYLGGNTKT